MITDSTQLTELSSKKSNAGFKLNNFDLLRIFAATQVLIGHSIFHLHLPNMLWSDVLKNFPGVPMFFVMSGFLISASFEKSPSTKIYFQNRFLRILPGLWMLLLVTTIIVICLGYNFFPSGLIWLPLQFGGLIYTPKFLENFGFHSYNGSLWTIPLELQFYFVLPALYFFKRKLYNKDNIFIFAFLLFALVSFIILIKFQSFSLHEGITETRMARILRYTFLQHIYMFFLGVCFYKYNLYEHKFIKGKALIWVILYLIYCYIMPLNAFSDIAGKILLGITAVSFAYTVPKLSGKIIKEDISYGVYIYHGLMLNLFIEFKLIESWLYFGLVIFFSYLAGFLSWRFIEKPFILKKKRSMKVE